ncbi:unnamed protein product, partial [Iphiclides podalirius]
MLVLWLLVAVSALLWFVRRLRTTQEPPEYPGAFPLIGHIPFLFGDSSLIADPDDALTAANACLEKNFMYNFAKSWLGDGLITSTLPIWKKHRKLLNPTFSQHLMYSYTDVFNRQARRLVGQLARHSNRGDFDHLPVMHQNALETICKPKSKPFIELLFEMSEGQGLFTDDQVRKHVDTIIVSGYETIASVLCFTLILIGSYPRVQERILTELNDVFDATDRDVTRHDLSRLVYLEAVIKESMRVYTVAPIVARRVDRDVKLSKTYAMTSLKTTLVHLLRHYIVSADHKKMVLKLEFLLKPLSGHHISIEKRVRV